MCAPGWLHKATHALDGFAERVILLDKLACHSDYNARTPCGALVPANSCSCTANEQLLHVPLCYKK